MFFCQYLLLWTTNQLFLSIQQHKHAQPLPPISVIWYHLSAYCMAPSCDRATSYTFSLDFFLNMCSDICWPLDGISRRGLDKQHCLAADAYGDWLLAEIPVKWIWIMFHGGENVTSVTVLIINHCNRDVGCWIDWLKLLFTAWAHHVSVTRTAGALLNSIIITWAE